MKDSGKAIVLKNTIMLYAMTAAKYIFPLLLFPYLTRALTPTYYGIITYMTSIANYVSIVIDFGFNLSATRKIAQNKNDPEKVQKIYSAVVAGRGLLALASGVAVFILSLFTPILRENFPVLFAYYLSMAVLVFLPDYIYRGFEKMQGITIRYVISKIVTTVLTLLVVKGPEQILYVPIFNGVGNLCSVLFTLFDLKKTFGISLVRTCWRDIREEISSSWIFFVSTFATTAFTFANTLFMGFVDMSETDIAYWGVAFQLISLVLSMYDPIVSSLYPRMVISKDIKLIRYAFFLIMPIVVAGCIFCYFGAPLFVQIVGGEGYEGAILIFRLMIPVLLFSYPAQLFGFPVLGPIGQEKYVTTATVIGSIFHVLGLVLLLLAGQFTLITIAVLRSITEFVFMAMRVYFFMKNKHLYSSEPCRQPA